MQQEGFYISTEYSYYVQSHKRRKIIAKCIKQIKTDEIYMNNLQLTRT